MKARILILAVFSLGIFIITGCSNPSKNYEKLIQKEANDGGVWGKFPVTYDENGIHSLPIFPRFEIVEFNEIKILEFHPITGISKESLKNTDIGTAQNLFSKAPDNCILSILNALPADTSKFKDPTAVLSEVSIAKIKPTPIGNKIIGEIKINDEYLNEKKRAWFIICTSPETYVAFACFEDDKYFNNLIELE